MPSDSDYWKGIEWDNIDGGTPYCNECEQWADDDSHCTKCSACYIDLDKDPDMRSAYVTIAAKTSRARAKKNKLLGG